MEITGSVVLNGNFDVDKFEENFTESTLSYASSYDVRNGVQLLGPLECTVKWGVDRDNDEALEFVIDLDYSGTLEGDSLDDFLEAVEAAADEQGLKVLQINARGVDYYRRRLSAVHLSLAPVRKRAMMVYDSPEKLPLAYIEIDKLFDKCGVGALSV